MTGYDDLESLLNGGEYVSMTLLKLLIAEWLASRGTIGTLIAALRNQINDETNPEQARPFIRGKAEGFTLLAAALDADVTGQLPLEAMLTMTDKLLLLQPMQGDSE